MKRRAFTLMIAALLAVMPVVAMAQAPTLPESGVGVLFINVGKADSAVLFCDGKTYLVDTGSKGSADAMLRALETYGVGHLHGVFITHTDKDHVGGLKALLKSDITVEAIYAPKFHLEKSDEKHPAWEAANKHDIPMTWLSAGEVLPIGEDSSFTVLGPLSLNTDSDNDNSLVLYLQTQEGTVLLTGDMEAEEEAELLQAGNVPQADVLKVAHHGRKDTSSQMFIYTVRPELAVISTDSNQEPSSPAASVVRRLWNVGAAVAVTQDVTCGIFATLSAGEVYAEEINYAD